MNSAMPVSGYISINWLVPVNAGSTIHTCLYDEVLYTGNDACKIINGMGMYADFRVLDG